MITSPLSSNFGVEAFVFLHELVNLFDALLKQFALFIFQFALVNDLNIFFVLHNLLLHRCRLQLLEIVLLHLNL